MTDGSRPLSLFISYSHKDDALRAKLEAHLATLKRGGVFAVWHDRTVSAGREWAGEISDALERADVVLLLVSADFLASDYCHDKEMTRAMQRHEQGSARVVPVILRACDWESSEFGKLQALPRDGRPIQGHPSGVDRTLKEVTVALREIANELRGETSALGPVARGETDWPPRLGLARMAFVGAVLIVAAALGVYASIVKPALDDARDLMRRGDYANAARELETVRPELRWLPVIATALEQARFGARLVAGEPIRNLAPDLERLRSRDPGSPNVLVFQGLSAYWIEGDTRKAIDLFTRAAQSDPEHVEAHFLAAGRHLDRAYAELQGGNEAPARQDVSDAQSLIDRALAHSPFARDLPRYANQRAELLEFQGEFATAYEAYARLAPTQPLSAVQSALVSWRLAQPESRIRHGLETAQTALTRLENESIDAKVGWSFRISGTETVPIYGKGDKLCLSDLVIRLSQALVAVGEGVSGEEPSAPVVAASPSANVVAGAKFELPEHCTRGAAVGPIRDIVCVQVLAAQQALTASDARMPVLENWRRARLRCDHTLSAPPVLPPRGAAEKIADGLELAVQGS